MWISNDITKVEEGTEGVKSNIKRARERKGRGVRGEPGDQLSCSFSTRAKRELSQGVKNKEKIHREEKAYHARGIQGRKKKVSPKRNVLTSQEEAITSMQKKRGYVAFRVADQRKVRVRCLRMKHPIFEGKKGTKNSLVERGRGGRERGG